MILYVNVEVYSLTIFYIINKHINILKKRADSKNLARKIESSLDDPIYSVLFDQAQTPKDLLLLVTSFPSDHHG